MDDRDRVAEARTKAADRLRRERDLGNEHDGASTALECRRARAQIDLGLAAPGRAREEHVPTAFVQRSDDALDRCGLVGRELVWLRFARQGFAGRRRRPFAAWPTPRGRNELQCARRRRPVIGGEPECEIDEHRRQLVHNATDRGDLHALGRLDADVDDDASSRRAAEAEGDHGALADLVRDLVRERPRQRARGDERMDRCKRHGRRA